jgi:hypothetical protein
MTVLFDTPVIESPPDDGTTLGTARESTAAQRRAFRLQATVRRGTAANLQSTWPTYPTIDDARLAANELLRNERVVRVTVVIDTQPPRFVEWINR